MFHKTVLENGIRIIAVPQKNSQTFTFLILVGTGSKYERKEIQGISHLLEHLLFKGTKKRPNQLAIAEPLDRVGGVYNAFTAEEYTGYFAKVSLANFDLALDVISDIYLHSKLEQKDIEKEKGVIIEEINMYQDHPTSYINTLWHKLLYGDQPAGWDIAGTKETVAAISRQDLISYFGSQYVAPNTVVCLAGAIPKINLVIDKIKKYFALSPQKRHIKKKPVVEKQLKPGLLLHYKKTDQTHLCLGVRGYHLFDSRKYGQEILADILGGMMSSRLFIKVREKLGLAYYIRTEATSYTDTGYLATQAGVDNKRVEKAISVILQEYKSTALAKIPLAELEKAKEHIRGKTAILLEPSEAQASFFGIQELLQRKILSPDQIYDKINKVAADDVKNIARYIFQPKNLNLALIGPWKNKDKFQKLLAKFN